MACTSIQPIWHICIERNSVEYQRRHEWVSIRRRRHERVVEVHVHLTEERMEPVIHRCHRCIGGEFGANCSNHLCSNEQVCVGKIDVGISCSRQYEFYRIPRVERRQMLVFYPAAVFYTGLSRWYGEKV